MVKKILFGVLVLVVLGVIFGGGGNDESAPATSSGMSTSISGDNGTSADAASDESAPASARVGQSARDAHFEFTVKSLSCGVKKIGARFLAERAQGQFCVATIKVSNLGVGSQRLDSGSQYLYDSADHQFLASTRAATALPESQSLLFQGIKPGTTVIGTLVWDVPASGFKAEALELHDSTFSGGVVVDLP
jgi:hypothetical protein